jgi:hypothetical protein
MFTIPFPGSYKDSLLKGTKNTSLRIDKEIDKYKVGKIYKVGSYSGNDWKIKIKIDNILKLKIKDLHKYGIPQKSIISFKKKAKNLTEEDIVDLLKFHIYSD